MINEAYCEHALSTVNEYLDHVLEASYKVHQHKQCKISSSAEQLIPRL